MNDSLCEEQFQNITIDAEYINKTLWLYRGDPTVWKNISYVNVLKIFGYFIIVSGGLIGNISVILTIASNRAMRTITNLYIVNLAVADTMISVFCMPYVPQIQATVYAFGEFMCKFHSSLQTICLMTSVFTLSAISSDRFIAVMFPFHARVMQHRLFVVLTIVWISSVVVSIPHIIVGKLVFIKWEELLEAGCYEEWSHHWYYDQSLRICRPYSTKRAVYYVLLTVMLFFLPVLIMIFAYSLILWKLRTAKAPGVQHEASEKGFPRARKKVTMMFFVILVVFIICWGPFQAMVLYVGLQHIDESRPWWFQDFKFFARYMAYANSFLNPVIYAGMDNKIRRGMWNVLRLGYLRDRFGKRSVTNQVLLKTR